jgi:FkbM family methyltransferase
MLPNAILERLNRPGRSVLRTVVARAASAIYSVQRRRLHRFSVDADGFWVNRSEGTSMVSPRVHTSDRRAVEAMVMDEWCHNYVPRPGDVVIDVGAGIGEETVLFSRLVGLGGRVISIEAHPTTCESLRRTVSRNGLSNVTVVHCAVSDAPGTVTIGDSPAHHLNSIMVAQEGIAVPARTLDDVVRSCGVSRVDFLKMNIEGAERLAIKGMADVIRNTRFTCIACHDFVADRTGDDATRSRADVTAFLVGNGYELHSRPESEKPWVRDNLYGLNLHPPAAQRG